MRLVDMPEQRLTIYITEGLLDRLAIARIPGIESGHLPLLPYFEVRFRRWGTGELAPRKGQP
jgi:hypothetical protein